MKVMALSDISSGTLWATEFNGWHHHHHHHFGTAKRSQTTDLFRPVNLPNENRFKTVSIAAATSAQSKVCRSLFGPSDPNESQRLACEELNSRRYGDRSRWNFDFQKEQPITGRYDWYKIHSSTTSANHKETSNKKNHHRDYHNQFTSLWSSNGQTKNSSKHRFGCIEGEL
ncbi:diaminopimelate decarboxylase [Sarcoptes scabiei]|nr:diaminopimelate decarboxylase [Sarcoptes scabiei]